MLKSIHRVGLGSIVLALSLACSWVSADDVPAVENTTADEDLQMPPAPDAIQAGVVCLLPKKYHERLDGTSWLLQEMSGKTPPEALEITLGFHNGSASGYAGCNSYVATFINPNDILFGIRDLETTQRKCEKELCPSFGDSANWEEEYLDSLSRLAKIERTDTEMKLLDAESNTLLVFRQLK